MCYETIKSEFIVWVQKLDILNHTKPNEITQIYHKLFTVLCIAQILLKYVAIDVWRNQNGERSKKTAWLEMLGGGDAQMGWREVSEKQI